MSDKKAILKEINQLNMELNELCSQIKFLDKCGAGFEKKKELLETEHSLRHRIFDLQDELVFILQPANTNGIIDLRRQDEYSYYICLHDTNNIIGEIQYRGYHFDSLLGDVGYRIEPEYRGNKYAFQALVLLSELLYERGISDFWISTCNDNIASLKTIERYGGILIKNESIYDFINLYLCQTLKKITEYDDKNKKI